MKTTMPRSAGGQPPSPPLPEDDPVHGLDDGGEDPRESARRQVALLEQGLERGTGPVPSSAFDEAYRAAHLVRSSVDPSSAPAVHQVARNVQSLVIAVRRGTVPASPAVLALLRTAARAAADSLEAVLRGRGELPAAADAAMALDAFLRTAGEPLGPEVAADGPARFTRVEEARLSAARAAAAALETAAGLSARAARQASEAEATLRTQSEQRARIAAEVVAAIPAALAAAARGETVTGLAEELSARIGALASLQAESEESLARLASLAREAGEAGSRAWGAGSEAIAGIGSSSVRSVLRGIGRSVQSAAKAAGWALESSEELGEGEVSAAVGPQLRSAAASALKTALGPAALRARPRPLTLGVRSKVTADRNVIRLELAGAVASPEKLSKVLAPVAERLGRISGSLEVAAVEPRGAAIVITVPGVRPAAPAEERYLVFVAAGEARALPVAAVLECVPAPRTGAALSWNGKEVPVTEMISAGAAGAAVIAREGKRTLAIVVDSLSGEEPLRPAPSGPGTTPRLARPDGSLVTVLDLSAIPAPASRASKKPVSAKRPSTATARVSSRTPSPRKKPRRR